MPKKRRKKKGSGVDSLKKQQMAANYGFALAFMKSDKELWRLFNTAVKKTWDPNMFVAKLRATKWFKTHSADVRNAIMQKAADPATYRANLSKMEATLRDTWGKTYGLDTGRVKKAAEMAFRMGWSEAEALDHMSKGFHYQKSLRWKTLGGTAGEMRDQIKAAAENFGVRPGDYWMAKQLEKLVEGEQSVGGMQGMLREMAKSQYRAFATELDSGKTMMEIADPYIQKAAELLELNPNDVGLRESLVQKALTMKDEQGRPAAMNLNDFANSVRKDSRWQYTANAKKEVANVTSNLLQSFGLMS